MIVGVGAAFLVMRCETAVEVTTRAWAQNLLGCGGSEWCCRLVATSYHLDSHDACYAPMFSPIARGKTFLSPTHTASTFSRLSQPSFWHDQHNLARSKVSNSVTDNIKKSSRSVARASVNQRRNSCSKVGATLQHKQWHLWIQSERRHRKEHPSITTIASRSRTITPL